MDDEHLDLSAWVAPPAPSSLADRVIARVNTTDEAIAVTRRRRAKRRWWLAGGLAGALAAAAVAVIVIPHGAEPNGESAGSGTAVATKPQQLALAGVVANLDPGADVSWQQSGDAVHVHQRSGAATWRVEAPHMFLDVGAAVASIEASNSTLRVETRMNLTDTRVIGAAAVTSAAVALVTVIVFEGHVKLSGAGQTVVVQPGMTYEVTPGHAPTQHLDDVDRALDRVIELTSGDPTLHAATTKPELVIRLGEKVRVHDPHGSVRIAIDKQCPSDATLMYPTPDTEVTGVGDYSYSYTCNGIDKHGQLKVVQDAGIGVLTAPFENTTWTDHVLVAGTPVPARAQVTIDGVPIATENTKPWSAYITLATPSFVAVRIDGGLDDVDYYIRRGATDTADKTAMTTKTAKSYRVEQFKHGMEWGPLSVGAVDATMQSIEPAMIKCIKKRSDGQMLMFNVQPDGSVDGLTVTIDDGISEACVRNVVRHARFPKAKEQTHVSYSLAPPCDAQALLAAGSEAMARGDHPAALKSYEASLECKYDVHALQLTFMAACRSGNVATARRHWKVMNADMQTHLLQICLSSHITREQLDE